jgi:hypothetical protein
MQSESEAIDKVVAIVATEHNISICAPNYLITFHQEPKLDFKV